jgi:hypothetical protein
MLQDGYELVQRALRAFRARSDILWEQCSGVGSDPEPAKVFELCASTMTKGELQGFAAYRKVWSEVGDGFPRHRLDLAFPVTAATGKGLWSLEVSRGDGLVSLDLPPRSARSTNRCSQQLCPIHLRRSAGPCA